jgi:hypothetical protein
MGSQLYGIFTFISSTYFIWRLFLKFRSQSVLRLDYGLDDQVSILGRPEDLSRHHVQTGSGAHSASYPMGTEEFFPWG